MTLEELKAAWDEAEALAKADSKNTELRKAADAAKAAYEAKLAESSEEDDGEEDENGQDPDESKLTPEAKAIIKKLRDENAKHRLKNKDLGSKLKVSEEQKRNVLKAIGIELDDEKPEAKIEALTTETQTLAFRSAILELAIEHGIPSESVKYFQFLVAEAASEMGEGEEIPEEQMAEIIAEAKKGRGGKSATTTVGKGGKAKEPAPNQGGGEINLDQFCRMSMLEKSALYQKNPDLYTRLVTEAKAKRKLV